MGVGWARSYVRPGRVTCAAVSNVVQAEREAQALIESVKQLGRPLKEDEARIVRARAGELRETISAAHHADLVANRAEVISHGTPFISQAIRRAQDEARSRIEAVKTCSNCPAAETFRGSGEVVVHCAVERSLVDSRKDPQSLLTFCLGDYTACPSWRAEKERQRLGHKAPLVPATEGV